MFVNTQTSGQETFINASWAILLLSTFSYVLLILHTRPLTKLNMSSLFYKRQTCYATLTVFLQMVLVTRQKDQAITRAH